MVNGHTIFHAIPPGYCWTTKLNTKSYLHAQNHYRVYNNKSHFKTAIYKAASRQQKLLDLQRQIMAGSKVRTKAYLLLNHYASKTIVSSRACLTGLCIVDCPHPLLCEVLSIPLLCEVLNIPLLCEVLNIPLLCEVLNILRCIKDWVQLFCVRCLKYPWGGRYCTTNQKPVVSK